MKLDNPSTFSYLFVLGAGLVFILAGCQVGRPAGPTTVLDNDAFMGLWATYQHCRSGTDPDAMLADLRRLKQGAALPTSVTEFRFPLPEPIEHLISLPASRLAADPKAMVMACMLSIGRAALQAGRTGVATEMFRLVLLAPPRAEHRYYLDQARLGLTLVNSDVRDVPDTLPRSLRIVLPSPDWQAGHPMARESPGR
jgi:hypothetical protein